MASGVSRRTRCYTCKFPLEFLRLLTSILETYALLDPCDIYYYLVLGQSPDLVGNKEYSTNFSLKVSYGSID
ncbi:unnamed protein product [Linum trigynum]|uniref:Uncharacterized protein n=1 Tax=Linum trigynum TaxID=586398 RepID=A0AAV2CZJ4_9ROSI